MIAFSIYSVKSKNDNWNKLVIDEIQDQTVGVNNEIVRLKPKMFW